MTENDENGGNKAKTPISYLQEICMRKGVTPQYDLVANEGAVHEPLFVFKVIAGDVIGTGKGPSKKKAKHNAAISALNQMVDCSNLFPSTLTTATNESTLSTSLVMDAGDSSSGNPVGELQELTQKRMWPPPVYDHTSEQGPPHDRDFVCTVSLFNHKEQAIGKSKKLAKRNAAIVMLHKIKQGLIIPVDNTPKIDLVSDSTAKAQTKPSTDNKENFQSGPFKNSLSVKDSVERKKSSMFLKNKNAKHGKLLEGLKNMDFNKTKVTKNGEPTGVVLLQDLAKEQNFKISFQVTQSKEGIHRCMVEATTVPPCIMCGNGTNPDAAREEAARNMLGLLKILTIN